ncbi:MAG: hypothetical protein HXX81_02605 [Campylobacterales bacterium]|nr:hypothetical protein [Campylobacterales bacterium]
MSNFIVIDFLYYFANLKKEEFMSSTKTFSEVVVRARLKNSKEKKYLLDK